jgi:DNA-binding FadR family transcriptional regulator
MAFYISETEMNVASIGVTQSASAVGSSGSAKQAGADFKSLAQALQSGDLAGAQQAMASLQQDSPWVNRALSGATDGNSTSGGAATSPLQALSKALQSGDLAGAQQAFAKLQQAVGGHHGHHHHAASAASSATASTTATSAPATSAAAGGSVDTTA